MSGQKCHALIVQSEGLAGGAGGGCGVVLPRPGKEGGMGGFGLDPPAHDPRLLPLRGQRGEKVEDVGPPCLGRLRSGAVHDPLMFHQGRHPARAGGEKAQGIVGKIGIGPGRDRCGERAEKRRGVEICFQTAHD